eukprot:PhM_4_TR10438/c0_g1_i1/m.78082
MTTLPQQQTDLVAVCPSDQSAALAQILQILANRAARQSRKEDFETLEFERNLRGYWRSTDPHIRGGAQMELLLAGYPFPEACFPLEWSCPTSTSFHAAGDVGVLMDAFIWAVVSVGTSLHAFEESYSTRQMRYEQLSQISPYMACAISKADLFPGRWTTQEGILDLLVGEFHRVKDLHLRRSLIASIIPTTFVTASEFDNFVNGAPRDHKEFTHRVAVWEPCPSSPRTDEATPAEPEEIPLPSESKRSTKRRRRKVLRGGGKTTRRGNKDRVHSPTPMPTPSAVPPSSSSSSSSSCTTASCSSTPSVSSFVRNKRASAKTPPKSTQAAPKHKKSAGPKKPETHSTQPPATPDRPETYAAAAAATPPSAASTKTPPKAVATTKLATDDDRNPEHVRRA